jgi:cytochrome P450
LPDANRFAPEIWLDGDESYQRPLIPFSAGPAGCPGRNLVLLTTSMLIAQLLEHLDASPPQNHAATDGFSLSFSRPA